MGQCYSVTLNIKFKDKKAASDAIRRKISHGKLEHTDYSLGHYKGIGIGTESIHDLLRIIYGGWQGKLRAPSPGSEELTSEFDASYGWEHVMMTAFEEIAPFLHDGSSITIYPDSGVDKGIVSAGTVRWIS